MRFFLCTDHFETVLPRKIVYWCMAPVKYCQGYNAALNRGNRIGQFRSWFQVNVYEFIKIGKVVLEKSC